MSAIIVREWPRNVRETLRVSLDQFNGRDVVDVRVWYWDRSGELKPGRAGLMLSTRHLKQLAFALAEAAERAEGVGLIDERVER